MKRFRMPTAYTILFFLLIVVAAATWLIPAGSYQREGEDQTPMAGTYAPADPSPQGVGDVLLAPFRGFFDAVDVAVFILMVGGFLGVMMKTGAIDAAVPPPEKETAAKGESRPICWIPSLVKARVTSP